MKYSRKLENYLIGNQFTKLKSMSDCSCHSLNGTHIIEKSMKWRKIEKSVSGRCTKLKCEMKMTTTICTHTHKTLTHTKLAHFFPLNVPPSFPPAPFPSYLLLWDSGTHIHSAAPCPPLTNKFGHSIFHSTLHSIPNSQPPSRPHKSNELLRLTA